MLSDKEYTKKKGDLLIEELHLYAGHQMLIDAEELGKAICSHQRMVIAINIVNGKKSWVLLPATEENIKKAWGHGYLVMGKRWHRIGGNEAKAMRPHKGFKPLKRDEVEIRRKEAEASLQKPESKSFSGLLSKIPWPNKARRKMKAEKRQAEKVDKGILPKAKIIYTPMGNDRRRKSKH